MKPYTEQHRAQKKATPDFEKELLQINEECGF